MKKLQRNLHYFDVSRGNPELPLDEYYIFDEKHKFLNTYINKTTEIKETLITIKKLINNKEKKQIINKYYGILQKSLNQYSNNSEFLAFVSACDTCLDVVKKDVVVLEKITKRYFEKRLLKDIVPEEWVQALIDSHASRKKGQAGEKKLIDILTKNNYKYFDNHKILEKFLKENKAVARFSRSKKSDFNIRNIRKKLKIGMKTKKQNKLLDLIIKNGNRIFILEAKHINTSGGAQDKQISELIEILSLKEAASNIYYIAFLDGYKSNILLGNQSIAGGKLQNQQKEIKHHLEKNKESLWLNTAGFISLIKDLS